MRALASARRMSHRYDATSILTVYLVALLAIPAALAVPALGSAGAPSTILAICTFLYWMWYHLQRAELVHGGFRPVRAMILLFFLVELAVYVHAMSGPFPVDELTPADSGVLKLVGLSGIALVANDGIRSIERHRTVVRRLVIGMGLIACFGVFQYVTKQPWVNRISIPGLSTGVSEWILAERSGIARPSGTSAHPIEFGVVLTMGLPLVVAYAMHSPTRRWLYRILLALVGFAIFLSISRSAILCGAVGLVVLAIHWSWRTRLAAVGYLGVIFVLVYLAVPGLLGTITGLFTGFSNDPSVASRTGSYQVAEQFIAHSPWLGRGFGTFIPKYWILDNGYLGLLIDSGVVGLFFLLVLVGTAAATARGASTHAATSFDRQVAHSLLAAILAGATALAFFDMFAFPQSAGCLFLLMGLAGSFRHLVRREAGDATAEPTRVPTPTRGRSAQEAPA